MGNSSVKTDLKKLKHRVESLETNSPEQAEEVQQLIESIDAIHRKVQCIEREVEQKLRANSENIEEAKKGLKEQYEELNNKMDDFSRQSKQLDGTCMDLTIGLKSVAEWQDRFKEDVMSREKLTTERMNKVEEQLVDLSKQHNSFIIQTEMDREENKKYQQKTDERFRQNQDLLVSMVTSLGNTDKEQGASICQLQLAVGKQEKKVDGLTETMDDLRSTDCGRIQRGQVRPRRDDSGLASSSASRSSSQMARASTGLQSMGSGLLSFPLKSIDEYQDARVHTIGSSMESGTHEPVVSCGTRSTEAATPGRGDLPDGSVSTDLRSMWISSIQNGCQ